MNILAILPIHGTTLDISTTIKAFIIVKTSEHTRLAVALFYF